MSNNTSAGLGIMGVLQIIFIVLKLTGLITWSWAVVLIPLWIELGVTLIAIIALLALGLSLTPKRKK